LKKRKVLRRCKSPRARGSDADFFSTRGKGPDYVKQNAKNVIELLFKE